MLTGAVGGRTERGAEPGGEVMLRPAAIAISFALGTAGCVVGPNYRRPDVPTPPTFGELAPVAPAAGRSDAVADGTPTAWWQSFDDPLLTSLVARAVR